MSDEQVLGPNRYLEGEERAKAFKAPVMTAFSDACPNLSQAEILPTKYEVALQRMWQMRQ